MSTLTEADKDVPRKRTWTLAAIVSIPCIGLVSAALVTSAGIHVRRQSTIELNKAVEEAANAETVLETKQCIQTLTTLNQRHLSSESRARLLTALAHTHRRFVELNDTGTDEVYHLDCAQRCYTRALPLCRTVDTRRTIQRGLAVVEYLRGGWDDAQLALSELLDDDLPPDQQADLQFLRCKCLVELGRTADVYTILNEYLSRYTSGTIHDQAEILMAELLIDDLKHAHEDSERTDRIHDGRDGLGVPPEEARTRAMELLTGMLPRLPTEDERRLRVLNGLLELCILNDDVERAYETVQSIEGTTGHRDQQIRTFALLSALEENQDNIEEAEKAMRFCIAQFPRHKNTLDIRYRLYCMFRNRNQLQAALTELTDLAHHGRTRPWIGCVLDELMPQSENSLTTALLQPPRQDRALRQLRRLLLSIESTVSRRWFDLIERILFLKGFLAFHTGDIAVAEDDFARYMADAPYDNYLGEVLYMDARCAELQDRGPAVRAFRAHRYLTRFPEGERSEHMFTMVLQSYYEMALFEDNLAMAKTAFMHAMTQNGENAEHPLQLPVLQTALVIAQCSTRLGDADTAAPLFYRCARRLDELEPTVDFYLDWARAADAVNQQREAIRRLDVGSGRLPPGPQRQRLLTNALIGRCRMRLPGAASAADALLNDLRRQEPAPDRHTLRLLYQSLLDCYLQQSPESVPDLLSTMAADLENSDIPAPWALRYLRKAFAANDSGADVRRLKALYAQTDERGKGRTPADCVRRCLDHVEVYADLRRQLGELENRGLTDE